MPGAAGDAGTPKKKHGRFFKERWKEFSSLQCRICKEKLEGREVEALSEIHRARREVRSMESGGPLGNTIEVLRKRKKNQEKLGSSLSISLGMVYLDALGPGQRGIQHREEPGPAWLGPWYRPGDGVPGRPRQGHQGLEPCPKEGGYRAREERQHGQPGRVHPQPGFRPAPHQGPLDHPPPPPCTSTPSPPSQEAKPPTLPTPVKNPGLKALSG